MIVIFVAVELNNNDTFIVAKRGLIRGE